MTVWRQISYTANFFYEKNIKKARKVDGCEQSIKIINNVKY
jgi:hypothetical protein